MTQTSIVTIGWTNRPVRFGVTGTAVASPVDEKPARRRIGNIWTNLIYEIAHQLVFDRFVTELATVSEANGEMTVELCHTWRIIRDRAGAFSFSCWEPALAQWTTCALESLPTIALFSRSRGDLAASLISAACRHYIGYAEQRVQLSFFSIWDRNDKTKKDLFDEARAFAHDILVLDRIRHKQKFEPLPTAGGVAGAAIWKLIDRDWIRIVARIYQRPTFAHYVQAYAHRDAVKVVDAEHRNLLPVLRALPADRWADTALFAHYRWRAAATTPLWPVRNRSISGIRGVIPSRQAWRSFMSATAPLVAAWLTYVGISHLRFDLLFEIFARTKITSTTFWKMRFAKALNSHDHHFDHNRPLDERGYATLARLADCLFLEIQVRQARDGFRATADNVTAAEIGDLIDWWAFDGRARNLPDRPSTWASICRAVANWEVRRELERPGATTKWSSLIDATHIDGVDVYALDSGAKLIEEGEQMHHCVANYIDTCARHSQRIFSLRLGELRSTLRIALNANGWTAVENRSQCNETPDPRLVAAGHAVARLYADADQAESQASQQRTAAAAPQPLEVN